MIKNDVISTQRDRIYNSKRLMAFQKSILHHGISFLECFLKKTMIEYIIIVKY